MHLQALHAQYLFNDASVCLIVSLSLALALSVRAARRMYE